MNALPNVIPIILFNVSSGEGFHSFSKPKITNISSQSINYILMEFLANDLTKGNKSLCSFPELLGREKKARKGRGSRKEKKGK